MKQKYILVLFIVLFQVNNSLAEDYEEKGCLDKAGCEKVEYLLKSLREEPDASQFDMPEITVEEANAYIDILNKRYQALEQKFNELSESIEKRVKDYDKDKNAHRFKPKRNKELKAEHKKVKAEIKAIQKGIIKKLRSVKIKGKS